MSEQHSPAYDAYLDDPFDDTTGFGYGLDAGADTAVGDESDAEPDTESGAEPDPETEE
jgi:hypothetical protein